MTVLDLARIIYKERPDIVHMITIKPVLYGGLLCRILKVPACVYAISGLGAVFSGNSAAAKLIKFFVKHIYRFAIDHRNAITIFQNLDDKNTLLKILNLPNLNCKLIRGSGVDINKFMVAPEPQGVPVVTLPARLLKDKGIVEFVKAAKILHERGVELRCQIAGDNSGAGNPAAFSEEELTLSLIHI